MYTLRANVPLSLTLLFHAVLIIEGQSPLHEKLCGILYNEQNFAGDTLAIKDASYFADLGQTHVTPASVWNATKSFQVEKGCLLTACNESYFDGVCQEFSESVNETPLQFDSLLSVNCTCATECKCSDVHMRKTSCARAYIKQGCNTCNAFYTEFKGKKHYVPDAFKNSIASIMVRKGCSLTVYDEENYNDEDPEAEDATIKETTLEVRVYRYFTILHK